MLAKHQFTGQRQQPILYKTAMHQSVKPHHGGAAVAPFLLCGQALLSWIGAALPLQQGNHLAGHGSHVLHACNGSNSVLGSWA